MSAPGSAPVFFQTDKRQRAKKFCDGLLDGRLEKLAADLRAAGELDAKRMAAFDALAEKAKITRERILGSRAVRLSCRLDEQTES